MTATPSLSTRKFFDTLAPQRERDKRRHRTYYRDRERWLRRLIRPDASVLELGCGTGLTLSCLPQAKKTGIDFSPEMIRLAHERDPQTRYLVDDILQLEHRESHDYVLLLDTINFLRDVQRGLQEIHDKVCHDRTRLVITYYNFLWQPLFLFGEWLGWKTKFPEQNWLGRNDIEHLLRITGFEVVQRGERVLCPPGIPLLASLCNRFLVSLPLLRAFALVKYVIARPAPRGHKTDYTVTVLSAVRNERGNIRRIVEAMPILGSRTELLFIEGHSTDGTWEELQEIVASYRGPLAVRALKQSGSGKGSALHDGITESAGEILLVYDGDFTVHPDELRKLYDILSSGQAEFVNASRLVYPLQEGAMRLLNLLGNKIFSMLFTWLFSQRLVDVLSPVKGFFRRDYPSVTTRMDPFGDFDFFLGAASRQLKMSEVPVHYLERSYGTTKIRRFRHGWSLLRMCFYGTRRLKWV